MPEPETPTSLSTTDIRTLLGIITEDEFGRAVGVVGPTVAIWRNRGEGPPFFRFRRNIFYRTADVVQWIIENTRDPATDELLVPRVEEHTPPKVKHRAQRPDGTLELTAADVEVKSTRPQAALDDAREDRAPSAVGSE